MRSNHVDRAVDGVTLADAPQVDPNAFAVEGDRVALRSRAAGDASRSEPGRRPVSSRPALAWAL